MPRIIVVLAALLSMMGVALANTPPTGAAGVHVAFFTAAHPTAISSDRWPSEGSAVRYRNEGQKERRH